MWSGDDHIDAARLQRTLGLKSEYLAHRILAFFDTNKDGVVSREEFLSGVRALVFGRRLGQFESFLRGLLHCFTSSVSQPL